MADERQNTNVSELLSMQLGQAGVDVVSNTSAATPQGGASEWFCIQALTDTVISTVTELNATLNGSESTNTSASAALAAGGYLFGTFTGITLTSGKVRCYREPER